MDNKDINEIKKDISEVERSLNSLSSYLNDLLVIDNEVVGKDELNAIVNKIQSIKSDL